VNNIMQIYRIATLFKNISLYFYFKICWVN
jgi:hypothetical protein